MSREQEQSQDAAIRERLAPDDLHIEELAAAVHEAYLETCARLRWVVKPANTVPYAALPEDAKELDRASVRAVLRHLGVIDTLRQQLQALGQELLEPEQSPADVVQAAKNIVANEAHYRSDVSKFTTALAEAEARYTSLRSDWQAVKLALAEQEKEKNQWRNLAVHAGDHQGPENLRARLAEREQEIERLRAERANTANAHHAYVESLRKGSLERRADLERQLQEAQQQTRKLAIFHGRSKEAAERQIAALRETVEQEKRLGFTKRLGPEDGPFEPEAVVRLKPLEAALRPAAPGERQSESEGA